MRELLARVASDLRSLNARHAVVGGHAVSARTEPRFTRDLDFAVAVADDRQAEQLAGSMAARGYRIVALIEQEATGRLATVRLKHGSAPGVLVDLLFATAGVEPEVVDGATPIRQLAGVEVPVASVGHLLALKKLSVDEQKRPGGCDPGRLPEAARPRATAATAPRPFAAASPNPHSPSSGTSLSRRAPRSPAP